MRQQRSKLILTVCLLLCFNLMQAVEMSVNPLEKKGVYQSFKNITFPYDANIVNTMFQDEQGMMWFGTRRGLFSYNGYDFHNYVSNLTTDANFILSIIQISPELLCVGSNYGILTFNLMTERYEEVYPELASLKAIRSLALFKDCLWIGTRDEGLFCFDLIDRKLQRMVPESADETAVFALQPAGERLFIGSYEGLSYYDAAARKRVRIRFAGEERLTVHSLLWDSWNQVIWVGAETALYRYEIETGIIETVSQLGQNSIKTLASDNRGNLLAGTDAGLYVYSLETENVLHIVHDSGNGNSLANNIIWNILCDSSQNLWIATDRGVSQTHIDDRFRFIHLSEIVPTSDGNPFTCLDVDSGGDYWLGGENGLIHISPDRVNWFRTDDSSFSLKHNHIRRIYEDRSEDIWIATDGSIARYDRTDNKFVYYNLLDRERNKDAHWAYDLYNDENGRLWVATYLGGLFVVNKAALEKSMPGKPFTDFIKVLDEENGLSNSIYELFPDGKGNMWANTQNGLACIDMDTYDVIMKTVYMDNMIMADGNIYFSSEGRLFRFNIAEDTEEALPFSVEGGKIYAFVQGNGRVWFSATNGIFYYDMTSCTVERVSMSSNFLLSGFYCSSTDEILWGGEDCVYFCSAGQQPDFNRSAPVFITGLSRDENHLVPDDDYEGCSPRFQTSLKLGRRGNVTLELSTFQYGEEEEFYYKLTKKDEWHILERGQNHINFVEPGGGDYLISLCSSNPVDNQDAAVSVYMMTVPYPWYASWPARCLYFLVLVIVIVLVYRLMQRRMRRRYELRQKEEMLAMSNMKMDFFVNMSHELKTPLSLIIAPLSKLMSETTDPDQKKSLNLIHKNALRLNSLIYNVLDFKQIEYESENTLIRSSVELRSLIENCISIFSTVAGDRGVTITFSPQIDSVWLSLDTLKIESVFINLISNALKYVPDNSGKVDVSLRLAGGEVCATVSDNGPGIRDDELHLVFIRYFQGKNKARDSKGTGIGLYLVKKFVELHDGRVELRNDGGLSVEVVLPIDGANSIAEESEKEPYRTPSEEKKTVLIIDDNKELVAFLDEALSSQYLCMRAYNGKEGIRAVKERMPDLIIVDQMMPEMDGMEFTRTIRHNYPTSAIPVIMLTAKDDAETELKSIRTGIDVFISKPFDLKKLILRVAQLLQRQQSLEQAVRIETIAAPKFEESGEKGSADEILMKKISAAIEENMQDEGFGVAALAEMVGVESKQLYRKVRQMTGLSPVNYIRKLRMKKAALLLAQRKFTVSEVMYLVGYTNASYFTKCFAQEFGVTPTQYVNDCIKHEDLSKMS